MTSAFNFFHRKRPPGRFRLAHPLREPARAVAQSFVYWPAAAIAAIMYAGHLSEAERSVVLVFAMQITVLYPIIAGACFAGWFFLARAGREQGGLLLLVLPLAIVAVWAMSLALFVLRFLISLIGHWVHLANLT